MADKHWTGLAPAVAQVGTASIDSVDGTPANNTFTVTVGGVAISQVGDTDVATTAAALVVLLAASTHPYFAAVTWTNPSAGNIVATADTAGVPFVAALTETGAGTGAVTDFAATVANAGPNAWATAANWSDAAVPVNTDNVTVDRGPAILWDLDQSAVTLTSLRIMQSYNGPLGLPTQTFTTSPTGEDATKPEYRETYLKIGATTLEIGAHYGPSEPGGAGRIKIDTGAVQTKLVVLNSSQSPTDTGLEPIRWLGTHASNAAHIQKGWVGIATDTPYEDSDLTELNISHRGSVLADAVVQVGAGVTTLTTVNQSGGDLTVRCAMGTLEQTAGRAAIIGAGAVTTANIGGTLIYNSTGTLTTLLVHPTGTADFTADVQDKEVSNCTIHAGATLLANNGSGDPLSVDFAAGIILSACDFPDVTLSVGRGFTATLS